MTINRITKSPTPTEIINKVNELVEGINSSSVDIDAKTVSGKSASNTNNNLAVWGSDGKLMFPNGTQFWIE